MQTIEDLIARRKIRMTVSRTTTNPNMPCADTAHWRCTLRSDSGARVQIVFSTGSAHGETAPNATEVLDCLASDASSVENAADFSEWCADLGFDTDSRKAERAYRACQRTSDKLRRLVGHDYEKLLFETERL